jgi:hypothetical protein
MTEAALPRRLRSVGTGLRTILVSVTPILLLKASEFFGITVDGPVGQVLVIGTIAWLLAGLLAVIDPLFEPHLAAAKDLMSMSKSSRGES